MAIPALSTGSGPTTHKKHSTVIELSDDDDYLPELPICFATTTSRGVQRIQALNELGPSWKPPGPGRVNERLEWSVLANEGTPAPSPPRPSSMWESSQSGRDRPKPAKQRQKGKALGSGQHTLDGFFKAAKPSTPQREVIDLCESPPPPAAKPTPFARHTPKPSTSATPLTPFQSVSTASRSQPRNTPLHASTGSENANPFQCNRSRTRLSPLRPSPSPSPEPTRHRRSRPSTPRGSSPSRSPTPPNDTAKRAEKDRRGKEINPFQTAGETTFLTPEALRLSQSLAGSRGEESPRNSKNSSTSSISTASSALADSISLSHPTPASALTRHEEYPPASLPSSQRPARDLRFVRRDGANRKDETDEWYEPDRSLSPEAETPAPPVASTSRSLLEDQRAPPPTAVRPAPGYSSEELAKRFHRFRLLDAEWPQPKVTVFPCTSHPLSSLPLLIDQVLSDGLPLFSPHHRATDTETKRAIGFDLEWSFSRRKGGGQHRVAVMQLSSLSKTLVIRLSELPDWSRGSLPDVVVKRVLMASSVVKVGVNIRADGQKLLRDFPSSFRSHSNASPFASFIEFTDLARTVAPERVERVAGGRRLVSLQKLVGMFLERYLEKGSDRTGDWEARGRQLSKSQVEYAAADVVASARLFAVLQRLAETADPPIDCATDLQDL